jgi:hypothetical protein
MSGNGLFLNINLYAPTESEQLPIGEYLTSDSIKDFTIMPGALRQEGNAYYATGSYLGQYTDNGLSVIFLTEGNIIIENNGNYTITCSFIGSQTEVINATFNGTINTYDTSEENQVTTIEYSDSANEIIEIEEEPTLNHIKITLSHNDTIITFVARTPKSITSLPFGSYYLSDNVIAYTLVPNRCQMLIADKTTTITTASLQIEESEYYGSFTDSEGNKYLVKKQDNIRKQQIKSFVY